MGYDKECFEAIARKYIKRDGLEKLLSSLSISDFYTAPASTKFHDAHEGGLVKHSIRVWEELENERYLYQYDLQLSLESIAIVALFHDLCKIGYYTVSMRNVKNEETGKWEQVPYYSVDDKFPMGHGEKSVYMIRQFMELTDEEALAIRWHMGGFEPKENYQYLGKAYSETPLALLLHLADMKATYLKQQ